MYPCNSSAAKFLHSQPSKRVSKTRHTRTSNTSEALFNAPMGIDLYSLKGISGGWSLAAKPCDTCKATAAAVFCRLDSAFLCLDCDSKIHNSINKHPRVWMCAVCEQAPAAVTCKADAAALCVSCDNDIHSANPLSRRHERLPVEPFFDSAETIFVKSSALNFVIPSDQHGGSELTGESQQDGVDSASWMIPNPKLGVETAAALKTGEFLFADPFIALNHVYYPNSFQNHQMAGMDSLVPVQITKTEPLLAPAPIPFVINENCFDIEFCRSKLSSNNGYQNQSVSSSSLDVGVVPDGNSMPDISYAFGRNICTGPAGTDRNITVPASGGSQGSASQLCGIDREARVSRYREKRRNRKFEKTIRYQSRKAYAETRPRIKGRFAKRTDAHSNVDRLYNSAASAVGAYLADFQYGVVPSFADWVGNSVS